MKTIKIRTIFLLNIISILLLTLPLKIQAFDYELKYSQAKKYGINGIYTQSDKIFKQIIAESEKSEEYKWALDSYISLGYNQYKQNKFVKAIEYYSEAIRFKEKYKLQDYKNLDYLYKQYAFVNSILGNHIVAIEYYKKAQKVAFSQENFPSYYDFKISEITSLMYLGYYKSALNLLYTIEYEVNKLNNTENNLVLFLNIVDCNLKLNNPNQANKYLDKSKILINHFADIDYLYNYHLLIAQTFLVKKDTLSCQNKFAEMKEKDWGVHNNNLLKLEIIKLDQIVDISKVKSAELLELEVYFKSIDEKEALIEIYKYLVLLENNSSNMNKYLAETNSNIVKTKNYLNQTLSLNEKLNNDLILITERNIDLAYRNQIYLIVLIAVILLSILSILYCKIFLEKRKLATKNTDLIDNNFILKNHLASIIQELQIHIFTNDMLSKEFLLNAVSQLINYQRSIKEV
jgi:hypothetical protein